MADCNDLFHQFSGVISVTGKQKEAFRAAGALGSPQGPPNNPSRKMPDHHG